MANHPSLYQLQSQSFNSIFGGIFGRKKEPEVPPPPPPKVEKPVEPNKYHKESVQALKEEK